MEDDFVTVGSALPQCEDEDILSRKPVTIHDQVVRDEQGRIRFHGAFTGGFSAGYFNSVDTKEGWVPKNFKSSRSSRNQEKSSQKPEDFMDNEDFGEFGIAPKKLFTSNKYHGSSKHSWKAPYESTILSLFSNSHLQRCIEPAKLTVGQKLLRKIGWRTANDNTYEEPEGADVFGCALPPNLVAKQSSKKPSINYQSDTICPIDFLIQNNQFGLGYKGLAPQIVVQNNSTSTKQNKSKGIKGQAFGVGALEEEDDDIYCGDSASNYNTVLYLEEEEIVQSPLKNPSKDKKEKAIIDGFKKSSGNPIRIRVYLPPTISGDFMLIPGSLHQNLVSNPEDDSSKRKLGNSHSMNSFKRGEILGEMSKIGSIFDLISEKDRLKIEEAKQKYVLSKSGSSEKHHDVENFETSGSTKSNNQDVTHSTVATPGPLVADNQDKQESENVTEWEKEQKREKSTKASHFSLGVMMGRFTKASQDDDAPPEQKEKSAKEKAASSNMFGKLTREVTTWHPAKLLCVRFNVEDPYPESTIVGPPVQKHSKLSIFDVLSADDLTLREPQPPKTESGSKTMIKSEERTPASKPLAILATIDLRPSSDETENLNLIPADSQDVMEVTNTETKETATAVENGGMKDIPPPSMDIFKAIFEDNDDDDSDSTEDEIEDQQGSNKNEALEGHPHVSSQLTVIPHENVETCHKQESTATGKKKQKKEKHKKHKHSHKSKKSKKSKKSRSDRSDDSSEEYLSELSKQEKHLLSKLRSIS